MKPYFFNLSRIFSVLFIFILAEFPSTGNTHYMQIQLRKPLCEQLTFATLSLDSISYLKIPIFALGNLLVSA